MTYNKTINTTLIEYAKTVILVSLIIGGVAFTQGVQYQKRSTVTVDNKVVVQSVEAKK